MLERLWLGLQLRFLFWSPSFHSWAEADLLQAMEGHILGAGLLVGERQGKFTIKCISQIGRVGAS